VIEQINDALAPLGLEVGSAEAKAGGTFWTLHVGPVGMMFKPGEATRALQESGLLGRPDSGSASPSSGATRIGSGDSRETRGHRAGQVLEFRSRGSGEKELPSRNEPTDGRKRPEVRPGDDTGALLSRGEPGLVLGFRRGEGGIGVPPMAPEDARRMLADIFVGDAFLALRHQQVDEADVFAVSELQHTWYTYADEALHLGQPDPEAFAAAIRVWGPADFPVNELRFDLSGQGGK
jgi:hypothetical protein